MTRCTILPTATSVYEILPDVQLSRIIPAEASFVPKIGEGRAWSTYANARVHLPLVMTCHCR